MGLLNSRKIKLEINNTYLFYYFFIYTKRYTDKSIVGEGEWIWMGFRVLELMQSKNLKKIGLLSKIIPSLRNAITKAFVIFLIDRVFSFLLKLIDYTIIWSTKSYVYRNYIVCYILLEII